MEKRKLGQFGLQVSSLGLGCMGMSWAYGEADDEQSTAAIDTALDSGINFFDTADMYGAGANEILLGKAIKGHRESVVLATKFGISGFDGGALQLNGRPKYVKQACEASLKRLNVDFIDLYYFHRVDPQVPIEDTVGAMKELIDQGKVRYLGLSEASPETINRATSEAPISALQSEYSLWTRDLESEVIPLLKELKIGLVPYSPLGRGFLTGKCRSRADLSENDFRRTQPRYSEDNFQHNLSVVKLVEQLAAGRGCTAAQLALAWVLASGDQVVPIPGTKRAQYVTENIGACRVDLRPEEIEALNSVCAKVKGDRYSKQLMRAVAK